MWKSFNDGFDNSVIKFGADLSSSAHFDSKKQDILISAKGLTQWLDNTTLTAEVEYLIKESLPYNGKSTWQYKSTLQWNQQLFIC